MSGGDTNSSVMAYYRINDGSPACQGYRHVRFTCIIVSEFGSIKSPNIPLTKRVVGGFNPPGKFVIRGAIKR